MLPWMTDVGLTDLKYHSVEERGRIGRGEGRCK